MDEYTRECLAIDVADGLRSGRVIEVLSRLISERGTPLNLRSDNGPEFVSKALLRWATRESLDLALIEHGKPWKNGVHESFTESFATNGRRWTGSGVGPRRGGGDRGMEAALELRSPTLKPEQHDARTFL